MKKKSNTQLKLIASENLNFSPFTTKNKLLNYILYCPRSSTLIIFSTYRNTKLNYFCTISSIPNNKLDIYINFLKRYTWTISYPYNIKTYDSGTYIHLIHHLENDDLFRNDSLKVKIHETSKSFKKSIENTYINSYSKKL